MTFAKESDCFSAFDLYGVQGANIENGRDKFVWP